MDPKDVILFTEYRLEAFRRERDHQRLVQLAKQSPIRGARIFRFLPLRWRESATTTD